jgi:hypothetical protein
MDQSENLNELATALINVQATEIFALTDKENPFFKSKYADLSSVWIAIREPLTSNNLCAIQTMDSEEDGTPVVVTTLAHKSGQWIRGRLAIKPDKPGPQALGSAITYGRRYSLAAIIGVCPEDDDANSATKRNGDGKTSLDKSSKPANKTDGTIGETATAPQYKKLYAMMKGKKFSEEDVDLFKDFLKEKYKVEHLTKKIMMQLFKDKTPKQDKSNFERACESFLVWEKEQGPRSDNEPPQEPPLIDDGGIPF